MAEPLRIRIRRRLSASIRVLSLILCLATAAVCVRGFWRADSVSLGKWWRDGTRMINRCYYLDTNWRSIGFVYRREIALLTSDEQERLQTTPWEFGHGVNKPPSFRQWARGPRGEWMRWLGFYAHRLQETSKGDSLHGPISVDDIYVGVPSLLVMAIFALLPVCQLRKRMRHVPRGVCSTCGYDLRATPERCPECGRVAATVE